MVQCRLKHSKAPAWSSLAFRTTRTWSMTPRPDVLSTTLRFGNGVLISSKMACFGTASPRSKQLNMWPPYSESAHEMAMQQSKSKTRSCRKRPATAHTSAHAKSGIRVAWMAMGGSTAGSTQASPKWPGGAMFNPGPNIRDIQRGEYYVG